MIVITRTVVAAIIEWFSARVTATASPIWDKNDWERVIKFTLTKINKKILSKKKQWKENLPSSFFAPPFQPVNKVNDKKKH